MTTAPLIVWFRQDLRIADNPALQAAAKTGRPLLPVYIFDDVATPPMGGASRWWLHGSLQSLEAGLGKLGLTLILRRGNPMRQLDRLIAQTSATGVFWNRRYEPTAIASENSIRAHLNRRGIEAESFNSALLFEPWELKTKTGGPFRVFTPFWKAAIRHSPQAPSAARIKPHPFRHRIASDDLAAWHLRPRTPDWAEGLRETWQPGEAGARARWRSFMDRTIRAYHTKRDLPGIAGTSRLSPHLHFGEISPRQLWASCAMAEPSAGIASFQRELIWREFCYHLLYHFPKMPHAPLRPEYASFPWKVDRKILRAWQQGGTGYPIVDAGMRELWRTGWMHNRVRMIVASFLVKHLLQPWQAGAAWFWDTLVDADKANNSANWQWVAGCGMDAAPYFRVFNPILQGRKFDADGAYVRRWVPELAALPDQYIHAPWEAPRATLHFAKVRLNKTYPARIVDHEAGRKRALAAFKTFKAAPKTKHHKKRSPAHP